MEVDVDLRAQVDKSMDLQNPFFRISKSMTTRKFDLTKSALYGYGECFSEYHDSHQIWTDSNREFMHMETVILFREKNYGKNTSHFKGKNAVKILHILRW